MIILCFRCGKRLESPNFSNADYVVAEDTKVVELSETGTSVEIQKTGIICPDCYKETDTVIWGVHKK